MGRDHHRSAPRLARGLARLAVRAQRRPRREAVGGATAFPRARGVWRDDEREQRLVWDEPVVIHCYASATDVRRERSQRLLGEFCREMGRATNQGEVGLVIDNVYHAIRFD